MSELICKACDKPIIGQYSSFVGWSSEDCQPVGVYYHNECVPPLVISEPKTIITADILADWANGHTLLADNLSNTGHFKMGELADKINEFFGVKESKPIPSATDEAAFGSE